MGLKLRIHPLACAIASVQLRHLQQVQEQRKLCARRMSDALRGLPGIRLPEVPSNVEPSWYALLLQYREEELGGLPVERFYRALHAEGCHELDRPSSTCPLNLHPLFQQPGTLFKAYEAFPGFRPEDFPRSRAFHDRALKLPVWHDDAGFALADRYVLAIGKVVENHRELLQ
jgi:perosamine synthetase